MSRRTLSSALRTILLTAALCLGARSSVADEPRPETPSPVRWIHVPADNPQSWPNGPWVAVPSARLKSWMSSSTAAPPLIWIREAQYQAVYRDGILADGQMTANLKSTPGRGEKPLELLDWSGSNLAFDRLVWPERAAELGETPGGRTWLLVPRGETRLSGSWTRQGRPLTNGRVFDLTLPPAAVSELRLDVPRGLSVRTGSELPTRREPSHKVDHDRWVVSTGSRRDVQVVIVRDEPEAPAGTPRLFHRSNTAFAFAQDEFRLRQELLLEAPEGPIDALSIVLPDQIEIRQVILGNAPLSSWKLVEAPTRQVEIRFPEPIVGLSRPLVLVGRLTLQPDPASARIPDEPVTLDPPRPRTGTSMSEQVTLNVLSPLELKSIQADGYRQIAVSSSPGTSHSLIYQRYAPDALLRVRVGPPQSLTRVSLATRVDANLSPHQAVCDLHWRMSSGESYEVAFRVAPGWEPETIEIDNAEQPAGPAIPDWFVKQPFPDGSQAIGVELPRSLNPDHPQRLRVRLRRTVTDPTQPLSLPLIEPIDARRERHLIALRHSPMSPDAELPVGFRKISLDELPSDLRSGSSLQDVVAHPAEYDLFSVTGATPLPLRVWDRSACRPNYARVRVDVSDSGLREQIACLVPACGNRLDRLRISLPAGTSGWIWSVTGQPRTEVTVAPRETLPGRGAAAAREDWELQFTPPLTAEFELVGTRELPLEGTYRVALPWPIGTDAFAGEVEIRDPGGRLPLSAPHASSEQLQPLPLPPEDEAVTLRARYTSSRAQLLFGSHTSAPRSAASHGVLKSTAHHDERWFLDHELTFLIAPGENSVEWSLPPGATFTEVQLDGERVSLDADDRGVYRLDLQPAPEAREVGIAFRTFLSADRWTFDGTIPLPEVSPPLDALAWTVFLPSDWEISPQHGGPLSHTPTTGMTWVQRLFGPLGRTAGEDVFNPLERNAWRFSPAPALKTLDSQTENEFNSLLPDAPPLGWREWNFSRAERTPSLALSGWSRAAHRNLAWVALFACLTVGVALRILRARFRTSLGAFWIAGTIILILLAPPRWAETVGGLFTGSLVAALLPRAMILGQRARTGQRSELAVPTGSTVSRQPVAMWLAAVLLGGGIVSAQSPTTPVAAAPEPRIDVLVPYQTLPVPEELPEIVYLRERDHRRLFSESVGADRDLLLTAADYNCTVDASGLAELRADFALTLLETPIERIVIPLRGANLAGRDACLVDGRTAAVTIDEQGRFVILLPPVAKAETPDPAGPPVEFRRVSVSLKLYPPTTTTDSGQRQIDLELPLLSTNHLTVSIAPELDQHLFLEGAEGETRVSPDGRRLECQLGRARSIRLGWRPTSAPAVGTETAPRVDVSALAYLETRLTHLVYRIRASHAISAGRVEALTWTLPAEWSLRSLTAPGLLQHRLRVNPDGTRSLVLDLRQPSAAGDPPLVADAVFLAPSRLGTEDELHCPLPDLFSQRAETVGYECRTVDFRAGIWSPPEVALTPFELPPNRLRLFPVEEFLAAWPADEQLPSPRFCYSVQQLPTEPTFVYTTTRPKRQAQGVQLQGILRGDALEWGWSGEIVTSETPAFQHEFRIDPRLEILSVSVKEDRAERLNRWSVRDGQLTILLNRKTEGRQTVEIEARMPILEAGSLKLPEIRPLQAELSQVDLELSRSPLWDVALASTTPNQLQPDEAVPDAARGLVPLARYQLPEGAVMPSVELKRADERRPATRRSQLRLRADARFDLIATFEIEPANIGGELSWRLPTELTEDMSYDSGSVELVRENAPDGSTTFRGVIPPLQETATVVEFRMTLRAPDANRWTLPLPELIDARLSHDRFICRASDGWFPVPDRGEPARTAAETDPNDAGEIVFDVKSTSVELRRAALVRADTVPKIPLLLVWSLLELDRPLSGRWLFCYEGSGLDDLTITSSHPLRDVVCRVNGRRVESTWSEELRQLNFPLPPRPGVSIIEIDWTATTVFRPSGFDNVSIPRPRLEDVAVQQSELALFHANHYSELTHTGVTEATSAEFRYRVLEKLVTLLPSEPGIERDPATVALREFASSQLTAFRRDSSELDSRGLRRAGLDSEDVQQLLTEAAARLEPPDPTADRFSLPGLSDSQPLPEFRFLAGSLEDREEPRLWLVDRSNLRVALAIALALIAIPLGRWLFRFESGEWLGAHRARGWLMLGLLWWFGFRFSALGAALTFAAFLYWSFAPTPRVVKGNSAASKPH